MTISGSCRNHRVGPRTDSPIPATGSATFTATAHHWTSSPLRRAAPLRGFASPSASCRPSGSEMPTARWRVVVADDEPAARRGVRQLLDPFPDFAIVGECRDGKEVLAALDSLQPDVLFLDILMPEVNGFEVIRRRTPELMPAIVFLTAFDQF